ncbi:MAG: YkgJ family cysteine cluster protein [Rhodospirillales bacterium]
MSIYEAPIKDGLRDIISGAIRDNGPQTDLAALFDGVIDCTSNVTDSVRATDPPLQPLACDKGCSHCCHQYDVGVTPFEILRIADHIRTAYTDDQIKALLIRLRAAEKRKSDHPIEDWGVAKFPCPLLEADKCSVYGIRPLVCRAMNSYSEERCRHNLEHPHDDSSVPMYGHQYEIAKFARGGIQRGLALSDLQNDILELVPALRIALTTPGATVRWLAGERLFDEAVSRLPPRARRAERPSNDRRDGAAKTEPVAAHNVT